MVVDDIGKLADACIESIGQVSAFSLVMSITQYTNNNFHFL